MNTKPGTLSLQLKYPQNPLAYTVQHKTRCDADDGWVTAEVNGQTAGYNFYWQDTNVLGQDLEAIIQNQTPTFPDYFDRPAGV